MPKKATTDDTSPPRRTLYTLKLDDAQMDKLKQWCDHRLWSFYAVDHARFAFKGDQVNVVAYNSGKVVIQGKKTEDFVTYVIEAEITLDPRMGYDEAHHPEWYEDHGGLDESGKGDLFGPVVSSCVIADGAMVRHWMEKGIRDSKKITTDRAIMAMEKIIRATDGVVIKTTFAGMEKYNALYGKFGNNLNRLLAWMHAKSLEDALKERRVPWVMLDQFTKQPIVQGYFKKDPVDLRMMTKAEADPVVAAASIIARATFVRQLNALSEAAGLPLPKGSGAQAKAAANELVRKHGPEALGRFAKMHFRTASEVLGLPVAPKTPWVKH